MRRLRTEASRWAAVVALAIGLLLVQRMIVATTPTAALLEGVLAVCAVLAAVKMWVHNCFESHLAALLVTAATAGGALLAMTAGLPGGDGPDRGWLPVVFLLLCATLPALLVVDARVRADHTRNRRRPYAP